jgi:structural maintenance of chromosome 4
LEQIEEELEKTLAAYQETCERIGSVKEESREAADELENKEEQVSQLKEQLQEKAAALNKAKSQQVQLKAQVTALKQTIHSNKSKIEKCDGELGNLKLQMTGLEEDDEMAAELPTFSKDELDQMSMKQVVNELEKTKQYYSGTQPNLGVLREYKQKMQAYKDKSESVEEAANRKDAKKQEYDDLRKQRLDTFMEGFTKISQKLKEMYQVIAGNVDDYDGWKC